LPSGYQGVILDIDDRKREEERFRRSAEQALGVLDGMPALPWTEVIDPLTGASRYEFMGVQSSEMLGYTPEELIAEPRHFERMLHPDDIRLRFGRPVALGDAGTFRRLFGLDDRKIETAGLFDLSGQILGLATVAWVRPGTAEVALIIRSDLQRRGLGATLLANVIDDARDAGFNLLIAYVGYGNLPMRRLARRFGFEFAGTFAEAELVIRR
jgi:RimJ/RimL family protein N-acetyltransferase